MKPFLSTEELLALLREKEEPACTAALEALRLSIELEVLRTAVRVVSSGGTRICDKLKEDTPKTAAALQELFDYLAQMPEETSATVENTMRKMLGPAADLLYRQPGQP